MVHILTRQPVSSVIKESGWEETSNGDGTGLADSPNPAPLPLPELPVSDVSCTSKLVSEMRGNVCVHGTIQHTVGIYIYTTVEPY